MPAPRITLGSLQALDAADSLAHFRDKFELPEGVVYLDGNSLGALPKATASRIQQVVKEEWGQDLISSWNKHKWYEMPFRIGQKLAQLLGAHANEVVVGDSTSINVYKVASAALRLRPGRTVIVSERSNFPTDLYMLEGLIAVHGSRHRLHLVDDISQLDEAVTDDVAAVVLTHVNYRTGRLLDLKGITKRIHQKGALAVWDLAHSAGAVPVDLNDGNADFAVGCGYKFLNGGGGAPSFVYVAQRHQEAAESPLTGWFGHKKPFAFEPSYQAANGIQRFLCGTPPILSMASLEVGVDLMLEADQAQLRDKSIALGSLFLALVEQEFGETFQRGSPDEAAERGSQMCIRHPEAYAIMQALIQRGVIGDFRAPDILRFGFTPLYTRYVDLWEAIQHLGAVMANKEWDAAEFKVQKAVT